MEILASTLYHKSHYPESHYQHSISNGISSAKILFSSYKFFFGKNRSSISNTTQYSFFCLVIQYQYLFDSYFFSLQLPTHPFRGIHWCSRQKDVWIFESTCPLAFWKNQKTTRKFFWELPSKTFMLETFLSTLRSFSKSCSEQLFCRKPVCNCFCKNEFHSTHSRRNFLEF